MKRLIKEYGKDKNNRDKMAAAAKRAVNRGDDRTYHNAISSLLKAGCSKDEMEDFQDKFEKNENKNMNKQVKLSESDFHDVVRGAVENILKEYTNFDKEKMYGKPSYNKEDVEDDDELNAQPTNNLATNEGKQYKVNEEQLHQIIKESVMRILKEVQYNGVSLHGNRPEDWYAIRDAHKFGSKGSEMASKNGNDIIDTDLEAGRCTPEQAKGRWLKALGKGAEKSKMMGFRK